jgi:hypothetical protein
MRKWHNNNNLPGIFDNTDVSTSSSVDEVKKGQGVCLQMLD